MNAKLKIETRVRRLPFYLEDMEKGLLQIPPFQRDKVWENKQRLDLFDSLKNGYPIGSILLWKPEEKNLFEGRDKIGCYTVTPEQNKDTFYILDGFQRLSTLFASLTNPQKTNLVYDEEEQKKNFFVCYDLDKEEFFVPRTTKIETHQIPIYQLIDTRASFNFERQLYKSQQYTETTITTYLDKYAHLGSTFIDYSLPTIEIIGGTIEEAVEIFSRVNSKGSTISSDWMVSALSYNKEQNFRLGTVIDSLLEELRVYNFHEIKRDIIFQCITNSFGKVFFDQSSKIEQLARRADFIEVVQKTAESIKKSVQFLYEELLVVSSKLLPYNIQLIFVTDFFNKIPQPNAKQLEKLKQWFWISSYANYFTIYSLSKQREAYKQFQAFLSDEEQNPVYIDKPDTPFLVANMPNKISFGSVRAKSFSLFLLNYANGFQKIDANNIDDLKLFYLFSNNQDAENFMPMLAFIDPSKNDFQTLTQTPKPKNLSALLMCNEVLVGKYFLNNNMKLLYANNPQNQNEILKKRKECIQAAEKKFVENLGMIQYA